MQNICRASNRNLEELSKGVVVQQMLRLSVKIKYYGLLRKKEEKIIMKKKNLIETKEIVLTIRDYIVKGDKRKNIAPFSAAMVSADITVLKDKKLERFIVSTPLDSDPTFSTCVRELVAQAVKLKWPELDK